MVGLAFMFLLSSVMAVFLSWKDRLESYPLFLRMLPYIIPLPYIAAQWDGLWRRWAVNHGLFMACSGPEDAVSRGIDPSQVLVTHLGFFVFYGLLGIIDVYLLMKYARKGPETVPSHESVNSEGILRLLEEPFWGGLF